MLPVLVALGAMAAAGCGERRDITGRPIRPLSFDPAATAASIHSLRFAVDNAIVVQVRTIADVLGLTSPPQDQAARSFAGGAAARGSSARARGYSARAQRSAARGSFVRGSDNRLRLLRALEPGSIERAVADVAARRAAGSAVPLFPINFLGKVFVFDAQLDAYVEGGDDGPRNGVRFELYVVDLDTGLPALPLEPFGFVDLLDESDAVSTTLRVRAFDTTGPGNLRIADYEVDGAFASHASGPSVSLLSAGFVEDQNGRFDFEFDELLEADDGAGLTRVSSEHVVVSAEGTEVRLTVEGDLSYDLTHSDLLFRMDIDGSAGLTLVDLTVLNGAQEGQVEHSGRVEVLVGGTVTRPLFTDPSGGAFPRDDQANIDEILYGIDDILLFVTEAYAPLADLFAF